jgi:hypothetical protein
VKCIAVSAEKADADIATGLNTAIARVAGLLAVAAPKVVLFASTLRAITPVTPSCAACAHVRNGSKLEVAVGPDHFRLPLKTDLNLRRCDFR